MSCRIRKPTVRRIGGKLTQRTNNNINLITPDVALSCLNTLITPVSNTIPSFPISTTSPDTVRSLRKSIHVSEIGKNINDDRWNVEFNAQICYVPPVMIDHRPSFNLDHTDVRPYIDLKKMARCYFKESERVRNPMNEHHHENSMNNQVDYIVID